VNGGSDANGVMVGSCAGAQLATGADSPDAI
jgi:hypothetical protein